MVEKKILVVDDERSMREFLGIMLAKEGYQVTQCPDGETALRQVEGDIFDLIIMDIRMPKMDGIAVLERIKEMAPETVVIMITAFASTDTAVQAMKLEAYDYIEKPFELEDIRGCVRRVKEKLALKERVSFLQDEVSRPYRFDNIVGRAPVMKELFARMEKLARTDLPVLIVGESGTGKELIARAMHYNGARREGPFVAMNCAPWSMKRQAFRSFS